MEEVDWGIVAVVASAITFVTTFVLHVVWYNWWVPRDCRSCRHRSWKAAKDGNVFEWQCHRSGPRDTSTRTLHRPLTRPCCGPTDLTYQDATRTIAMTPRLWKRSWPRYIAYKLHCRFVFDEELVRAAVVVLNDEQQGKKHGGTYTSI